jgi:hypothetical protein
MTVIDEAASNAFTQIIITNNYPPRSLSTTAGCVINLIYPTHNCAVTTALRMMNTTGLNLSPFMQMSLCSFEKR